MGHAVQLHALVGLVSGEWFLRKKRGQAWIKTAGRRRDPDGLASVVAACYFTVFWRLSAFIVRPGRRAGTPACKGSLTHTTMTPACPLTS